MSPEIDSRAPDAASSLLGARYEFDGRPHLSLNALQLEVKAQLEGKLATGAYQFESVPCALCGGSDFTPLAAKDRYGLRLPVVMCEGCALVATNPRMDASSYNAFYDDEYRPLYGGEPEPTADFFGAQYRAGARVHAYVMRFRGLSARDARAPAVLEIGCGAGGLLQYFKDRGCRVLGLDLGEEYLAYGRREYGLDLRPGTLADVPRDFLPDLVIYSHVLEHLLDPLAEMRRLREVLAGDGALYCEVPGLRNLWRFYRMDLLRYLQNAHTFHFTGVTLRWMLEEAGLVAVACDDRVRSIFVDASAPGAPSVAPRTATAVKAERDHTLAYLRRAERVRHVTPSHPTELREDARSATFRALDAAGILPVLRRLLGRR